MADGMVKGLLIHDVSDTVQVEAGSVSSLSVADLRLILLGAPRAAGQGAPGAFY